MSDVSKYYSSYWETQLTSSPPVATAQELALFDRLLAAGSPRKMLDVGCGDGTKLGTWSQAHKIDYTGVDVSDTGVAQSRALGLKAEVIEDASKLPFEDAAFDLVTCTEVLEHLFLPLVALEELKRVTAPGGRIFVTVPNSLMLRIRLDALLLGRFNGRGDSLSLAEPWRDPHIRFFTLGSLRKMFRHAGLEVIESGGILGSLIQSTPGMHKLFGKTVYTPVDRLLDRVHPSLFASRLYLLARKPS